MEHTEIGPYGSRWVASSSVANRGAVFWTYVIGPPLVVVAVVMAAGGIRTLERSLSWVTHTREVREHLSIALSAILDAESAQRGYLLTQDTSYTNRFVSAKSRIPLELNSLQRLTSDNPTQQQTLAELRSLFQKRLAILQKGVDSYNSGARDEAISLLKTGEGRVLTDLIHERLDRMQAEEDRLLRQRSQQARVAMHWGLIAVYATGLSAIGLIGLVRYLTNTEQREQAARGRQLTEQARLLDLSRDAIIVRDAADRVRYWSQGAIDLYGYSREDALGRVTHDLLQTESDEPLPAIRAKLEHSGKWQGELRHTTRSGRKITTFSSWTLDRDDAGGVRTILEANNDMTARKIAEVSLQRSNEDLAQLTSQLERRVSERTRELSEANSELESFARSVAHDLREPLRTMQGFATALIQDYAAQLPAEGRKFAVHIATAARRMDQLILDLLTYARLSREAIRIESIALDEVMRTVSNELTEDLQRTGGRLTIEVEALLVRANRTLLTQVLSNLIANALKFVPPETRAHVRVSANAVNGRVRVCVADNGIGIDPRDHERIFGVFERLHGYETYPGTGIGLAIVRRAIERMGGTLGVISELGQGSRFWFELERGTA